MTVEGLRNSRKSSRWECIAIGVLLGAHGYFSSRSFEMHVLFIIQCGMLPNNKIHELFIREVRGDKFVYLDEPLISLLLLNL